MKRGAAKNTLGRRELGQSALAVLAYACAFGSSACGGFRTGTGASAGAAPGAGSLRSRASSASGAGASGAPFPSDARVELWSWFDLPDDRRSRELSGIAWDAAQRTLWAVQDDEPNLVALVPDAALRAWRFGETIRVQVDGPLDLEGLVALPNGEGFVVSSEIGPRILEIDRKGRLRREIRFPAKLCEALENKSLESLTMSPDGRWLVTASEVALPRDGSLASPEGGTRVRIVRIDRAAGEVTEHAYATDPTVKNAVGSDFGVADLAAITSDDLLVLERGWAKGVGNRVRVYRVSLASREAAEAACEAKEHLDGAAILAKKLFVDVAHLEAKGLPPAKQPQESPLLDNYEGIALGPVLADGRRTVFLVSDDNARSDQYARLLVLAVG